MVESTTPFSIGWCKGVIGRWWIGFWQCQLHKAAAALGPRQENDFFLDFTILSKGTLESRSFHFDGRYFRALGISNFCGYSLHKMDTLLFAGYSHACIGGRPWSILQSLRGVSCKFGKALGGLFCVHSVK